MTLQNKNPLGGAIIFFGMGGPKYTGGINFWKEKEGHKIFEDQNVGIHKMTTYR